MAKRGQISYNIMMRMLHCHQNTLQWPNIMGHSVKSTSIFHFYISLHKCYSFNPLSNLAFFFHKIFIYLQYFPLIFLKVSSDNWNEGNCTSLIGWLFSAVIVRFGGVHQTTTRIHLYKQDRNQEVELLALE